jgi:hypothetical protein
MHFVLWCYPGRRQTIKFGGSVEPDLGQPQVSRTDSAIVRFACLLEAFFGQGTILGGRFHLETPPSAPICLIVYGARATTKSYPLVYACAAPARSGLHWAALEPMQKSLQNSDEKTVVDQWRFLRQCLMQ